MIFDKYFFFRTRDVPVFFLSRKFVNFSDWPNVYSFLPGEQLNDSSGFIFRNPDNLAYVLIVCVRNEELDELYHLIRSFSCMRDLPDEFEFEIYRIFRSDPRSSQITHEMIQDIFRYGIQTERIEEGNNEDDLTFNYCR